MNIIKFFILVAFIVMTTTACTTMSVYKNAPSSSNNGYHRNEYNHRHGNAPPVPDQNQLPPQK